MTPVLSSLGICVVSLERSRLTRRCIDSLKETTTGPYRIYVVDNGSTGQEAKALLEILDEDRSLRVIRLDSNRGPAHARNRVVEETLGDHHAYAMLDNDMAGLPGWSEAARAAIAGGADVVQPKLLKADLKTVERGPNVARDLAWVANPRFIGVGAARDDPEVSRRMEVAIAGAGIYSRRLFETVGVYDERLFVAEDFDLSFRAKAAGLRIEYEPRCELVHDHPFDPEYDELRIDVERILWANDLMLEKHGKVLLSPEYLMWYSWLLDRGEPVFPRKDRSPLGLFRRARRRATREWFRVAYGKHWAALSEALEMTARRRILSQTISSRST